MKRQAGFTLLELLVSMTLLGFVFVLLFGSLRFGMRAWERGTTTTDTIDSLRLTQDLLRAEIERACPRRLAAADPQAPLRIDFAGEAGQMSFIAPAPGAAGGRRCVPLTLTVQPDGQLRRLTLGINRQGTDLLRHAQTIAFSYLAEDGVWRDGWSGEGALPALVRLRVTFPEGDTRIWPELFMTPRISAEADCSYDPATKSCRGG